MTTHRHEWRWWVALLVVISLIYPLVHNALLYAVNMAAPGLAERHPSVNLALMGWKDVVLLLMVLTLWRRNFFVFVAIGVGGMVLVLTGRLLALKEVLVPVVIAALLWAHRREVLSFYRVHERRIRGAAVAISLLLVTVGVGEMGYRVATGIDSTNWTEHPHLVTNNQYRCSKLALTTSFAAADLNDCLGTQLNFYKLVRAGAGYEAIPALFLPVGDSVVFGMLLVNVLALVLLGRARRDRPLTPAVSVVVAVLCVSVFLTLNRFSSLAALALTMGYLTLARRTWLHVALSYMIMVLVIAAYAREGGYLFASLFDLTTPSNIGHVALAQAYFAGGAQELSGMLDVWTVAYFSVLVAVGVLVGRHIARSSQVTKMVAAYIGGLVVFAGLVWLVDVPLTWFGSPPGTVFPAESNLVKVVINHGAVGFLLYNGILALLLTTFMGVLRRDENLGQSGRQQRWILVVVTSHILLYQLFSPYVISGFVVFASFMALWTIARGELSSLTGPPSGMPVAVVPAI